MKDIKFFIVDVFATEKYTGNQLAVFLNAESLSYDEMQKIAKEMNYSETTFVLSGKQKNGGYDVRIFTPKEELPFAGHPTLGTAFIIQQAIVGKPIDNIILNLKVGQIPVKIEFSNGTPDILWMKQMPPEFKEVYNSDLVAGILHLKPGEIDDRFPIQSVSTGLHFVIVPLRSLDSLRVASINRERYYEFVKDTEAKAFSIFCPETRKKENNLSVRVFTDYYGIPEDPATGSANGCLAGYLVRYRYFNTPEVDIRVEQGYEIGRPSILYLKAGENGEIIDVNVGGRVFPVAEGKFI